VNQAKIDDIRYMKLAFNLSKKGMGFTEPNPMVGAVVVKNNRILATGYHVGHGKAHAEQMAFSNLNEEGTTVYVTLEPCPHYGKTPPCSELLINKKVKRVVVPVMDPNPRVNGKGISRLREMGIEVEIGLLENTARYINRHYFKYIDSSIPYVGVHAGMSIDGKLTDKFRKSQWVTDEELRLYSHSIRGEFSAILSGTGTILDDNPQFTIREKEWENKRLYRVILDTQNRLPSGLKLYENREQFPLVIFSSHDAPNQTLNPNADYHFFVSQNDDCTGLNPVEVLRKLHQIGIASVLVEGGGAVIGSFLKAGLYDEILFFTADKLIGGKDSVQVFPPGCAVSEAIPIVNREIISFKNGYLVRGFRTPTYRPVEQLESNEG